MSLPDHARRILWAAATWGALWVLGMLVVLGPSFGSGMDPWGVLQVGGTGFVAAGVLYGLLSYVYRNEDLTLIGAGGLQPLRETKALGAVHVLATTWIAVRLVFAQNDGSFFFGFPGFTDVVALSTALFTVPIWAFIATALRLATGGRWSVLFFFADLLMLPVAFVLFVLAAAGIG